MQVPGTLVVAGDFNRAVTLNISRQKLSEYGLQPTSTPGQLSEAIAADIQKQPGLFNFETVTSETRVGADGRTYCDLEFKLQTCKGEIVEGRRGVMRCAASERSVYV